MIDWAISHVPVKARGEAFLWIFVALAFGAGLAFGVAGFKTRYSTRVVHEVRSPYVNPDQSVPGSQVNQALAGETCDVYNAKRTVVCHP